MKKKKHWLDREIDTITRSARFIPYNFVAVGLFFILKTPINDKRLICHKGDFWDYSHTKTLLLIHIIDENNRKKTFQVGLKRHKELLYPVLPSTKHVTIWTRDSRRNNMLVNQISTDGNMVIPYNWWRQTLFFWCFIMIGLLLIAPVEKDYKKWLKSQEVAAYYGADNCDYKLRKKILKEWIDRDQKIANRLLSRYKMTAIPCIDIGIDFLDSYKFSFFAIAENSLSNGRLCAIVNHKDKRYPIELVYYSRSPEKTGDATMNTVKKYKFRVTNVRLGLSRLPREITEFKYGSTKLKEELEGHYEYFMEPVLCKQNDMEKDV